MARQKDQAARRKDLVNAASRAIAQAGLAGLRVRDVAEHAATSAGLVTYYFPDLASSRSKCTPTPCDGSAWPAGTRSAR